MAEIPSRSRPPTSSTDPDPELTSPDGLPPSMDQPDASEDTQALAAARGAATAEGTVLGGRYVLRDLIASGGMAAVWRAHDQVLARTVAVKILHGHLAADEAFRERFRREAIAAAKLAHPAIVSVYDTGTDGDAVFLVMELVDGSTLKDVIAENGALSPAETATIGEKVARGLAYAHARGLVHRDVKPANILIGDDGSVKVADFGIVKAEEAGEDLTKTGMVLGTAAYVAPEQITAQLIDGRADQYALGCVLYEALAGRQPFKGDNAVATAAQRLDRPPLPVRQVRADVPRGLSAVLERALARDPADRFPSTGALADALAAFADADTDRTAALTVPLSSAVDTAAPPSAGALADDPSFLRSEGRWLAPVLALLLVAGGLVGVALATGVLETTDGVRFNFGRGSEAPDTDDGAAADVIPLVPVAVEDFDPLGDGGGENPDELPALLDADPASAWQTEGYDSPDLGGLKPGVGFTVALQAPARLERITLTTPTPGFDYEIRIPAVQGSATSGTGDAALQGWSVAATVDNAPATSVTELDGIEADRVLVWITGDLQPSGARYRAGFGGVEIHGVPAAGR